MPRARRRTARATRGRFAWLDPGRIPRGFNGFHHVYDPVPSMRVAEHRGSRGDPQPGLTLRATSASTSEAKALRQRASHQLTSDRQDDAVQWAGNMPASADDSLRPEEPAPIDDLPSQRSGLGTPANTACPRWGSEKPNSGEPGQGLASTPLRSSLPGDRDRPAFDGRRGFQRTSC